MFLFELFEEEVVFMKAKIVRTGGVGGGGGGGGVGCKKKKREVEHLTALNFAMRAEISSSVLPLNTCSSGSNFASSARSVLLFYAPKINGTAENRLCRLATALIGATPAILYSAHAKCFKKRRLSQDGVRDRLSHKLQGLGL